MFDRLAADGDRTTTDGEVIGRSGMYNEAGKMYARDENKATCGVCEGAWPIAGSARDWLDDGYPMVKDLDWVLCPCRNNRVLASAGSNALFTESKEQTQTPSPLATSTTSTYDEQFTLLDHAGHPLANVRYRILVDSGEVFQGTTDATGRTRRVVSQGSSRLIFQLEKC